MIRMVVLRLVGAVATLLVASIVIFGATDLLPGDAATAFLDARARPRRSAAAPCTSTGWIAPPPRATPTWIAGVAHGDLGRSVATARR